MRIHETFSLTLSPVLSDAVFDLDAATQTGGKVADSIAKMEFTDMKTKADADGVRYFDLTDSFLKRQGGGTLKEDQYYTHAYVMKWRASDSNYRSLLRHSSDHCAMVAFGSPLLGVYSNRNGHFRKAGYDIVPQQEYWDVVVVTGAGESATGPVGVTTFYTMDVTRTMQQRGTADRVCSGMDYYFLGHPKYGPGKISRVVGWNRVLTIAEIQALPRKLAPFDECKYSRIC